MLCDKTTGASRAAQAKPSFAVSHLFVNSLNRNFMNVLSGVLPVVHTPYHADFSIDFGAMQAQIDYVYECGAQGIVFALASEVLRLTTNERNEVAQKLASFNNGRGSFTMSVGGESSYIATENARAAEAAGASTLMAIPPVSVALGEDELRRYYAAILNAVHLPLVIQDASSYVGRPMTAKFQASLWQEWGERALFKPEAAPVGPVITEINELTQNKALVLEGSGGTALVENYRRGIAGTMPGADLCDAIVALWKALEAKDENRIYLIGPLVGAILALVNGLDGYLALEKYLMHKRGIFSNTLVRGPVNFWLDDAAKKEIDRLFALLQEHI